MKKRIPYVFLLAAVLCIFLSNNALAAWTQAKGHSYNQLGLSNYRTTEKYTTLHRDDEGSLTDVDGDIHKVDQEEFEDTKVTFYGEYGITDRLTIATSIPYGWQNSDDVKKFTDENGPSGVGDIIVGLRYQLVPDLFGSGVLMSVQGDVKIPTYDYDHPLFNLSLGDGQYDASMKLKFGRGFGNGYGWLDLGYKYRFENNHYESFKPSDRFMMSLGGGYSLLSWLSITGYIDFFKSVGNEEVSDEMVEKSFSSGLQRSTAKQELIRDTLVLESDDLNAYIGLVFKITPTIQTVVSYSWDLEGFGDFRTKNNAIGETVGVAFVYIH